MDQLKNLIQNKRFQGLVILALILLQFSRILLFVNHFGGLIQDSGWSLGIARSLAERGTYTTMVATFADPTVRAGLNLTGDFHIQDAEGRVYFRSDRPALIIPQALIFKIFGFNFWTYRAGSLLFLLLFLGVTSILLWQSFGLLSSVIFHLFLYLYPHLLIYLSFQTLGEMAALAYIMLAFILFVVAAQKQKQQTWWFFASGLAVGLALYSKLIAALALSSLAWLGLLLLFKKEATRREAFVFFGGCLLFPMFWEIVQLLFISWLMDFKTYLGHINHRYNFFQNYGRGIDDAQSPPSTFMVDKLNIISEISQPHTDLALLTMFFILLGGTYLIWYWREQKFQRNVLFLLWFGWLTHYLWFIFRSTGGVTRYNWISLMLGAIILAVILAYVLVQLTRKPGLVKGLLGLLFMLLLASNFWAQRLAFSPLISANLIESWRQKHIYAKYIQMPSMIIPNQAQAEVVAYIDSLATEKRVFYALGYHNGEIATQTGRVFYPLERRVNMPSLSGDVIIINPGIISSWRKPPDLETAILAEVESRCPKMLFRNDYYILCGFE